MGRLTKNQCLTLQSVSALPPGEYRAALLDAEGGELVASTFTVVGLLDLRNIPAWVTGQSGLQGCADVGASSAAPTLDLEVRRNDGRGEVTRGPRTAPNGDAKLCLTAPAHARKEEGVYRAAVFDSAGGELSRATFDAVSGFAVRNVQIWSEGLGGLETCFLKGAGLATGAVRARVLRLDQNAIVSESAPSAVGDSGHQCLSVASSGVAQPGEYRAILVDGIGRELATASFTVSAR